jgi:hypothetical protein
MSNFPQVFSPSKQKQKTKTTNPLWAWEVAKLFGGANLDRSAERFRL